MLKSTIFAGAFALLLTACASTKTQQIYMPAAIDGPREVALAGVRQPWTSEIESRLHARGYSVKRFVSTTRRTQLVTPDSAESFNEASSRVILNISGYAPASSGLRCVGGGYKFEEITAEVIDTRANETLASYSNAGYSENCAPFSQPIFEDIVNMVDGVFKTPQR